MNVTSANPELPFTLSDNTMSFAVTVWVNAVLLIEGYAERCSKVRLI